MAINCYCGLQGSGKSYETVSTPILDAIAHGRRVVTNVDGINEEKIHEYLVEKRKLDPAQLGKVIHIKNDDVTKPQFFPDEEKPELESLIQGGDLVAIDEAWRFWPEGARLTHEHMQFFRMHRHYTDPHSGVACDVVLMTQDISGLARALKNVIEFSFKMQKLKSLGLTSGYRIELYEGWKQNTKTRIDTYVKKYDPAIFPLYKSYSGGAGQEKAIDKRQNILMNKKVWFIVAGVVIGFAFSAWNAWRFFHPKPKDLPAATDSKPVGYSAPSKTGPMAPSQAATPSRPIYSETWRIVGRYETNGQMWVVLANGAGRVRVESPSAFMNDRFATIGTIDGEKVTTWSGALPAQSPIGELKK